MVELLFGLFRLFSGKFRAAGCLLLDLNQQVTKGYELIGGENGFDWLQMVSREDLRFSSSLRKVAVCIAYAVCVYVCVCVCVFVCVCGCVCVCVCVHVHCVRACSRWLVQSRYYSILLPWLHVLKGQFLVVLLTL